jgi:hypothetical protein
MDSPLGFDMEWCPTFRRGAAERRTGLVQLSDERTILLIQVSSMTSALASQVFPSPFFDLDLCRVPAES